MAAHLVPRGAPSRRCRAGPGGLHFFKVALPCPRPRPSFSYNLRERRVGHNRTVNTRPDEILGPCTSAEGLGARLGITGRAVVAKARQRELLRVRTADGVDVYPLWQVDQGEVLPGLAAVLAEFPESAVDGLTVAGWLHTPEPELGESPLHALVRGKIDRVRAVAKMAARNMVA